MSDHEGTDLLHRYRDHFLAKATWPKPNSIIAVSVICAETTERAEEVALSGFLLRIQSAKGQKICGIPTSEEAKQYSFTNHHQDMIFDMKRKMIIGNPWEVKEQLLDLQRYSKSLNIMILTIAPIMRTESILSINCKRSVKP